MKTKFSILFGFVLAVSAVVDAQTSAETDRLTESDKTGDGIPVKQHLAPGDHSSTLKVGDLERRYLLHVPPGYDGKKPVPVVIMFHGGGGTDRGAMRESGWAQKADTEGFLAVFPNATPPDPTQPVRFGTNGQLWNDGSGRFHAGQEHVPDVAFINAMIDDLIARFNVDRRRIYATGFSNGASMAFRVGVELSARIAAIAPFAGALWLKQPALGRPVSLYYITGDADPPNPIEGGAPQFATGAASRDMTSQTKPPAREQVATWARLLGCQADPHPAPASPGVTTLIHSGGRDDSEVRFTIIKDHGHVWPGGKSQLPESWVGKASDKFKATDAIWAFFQQHPANGAPASLPAASNRDHSTSAGMPVLRVSSGLPKWSALAESFQQLDANPDGIVTRKVTSALVGKTEPPPDPERPAGTERDGNTAATPDTVDDAPAWVTRAVNAPRVRFRTFESAAAKTKVTRHSALMPPL